VESKDEADSTNHTVYKVFPNSFEDGCRLLDGNDWDGIYRIKDEPRRGAYGRQDQTTAPLRLRPSSPRMRGSSTPQLSASIADALEYWFTRFRG
jgi:hypothetical protein